MEVPTQAPYWPARHAFSDCTSLKCWVYRCMHALCLAFMWALGNQIQVALLVQQMFTHEYIFQANNCVLGTISCFDAQIWYYML